MPRTSRKDWCLAVESVGSRQPHCWPRQGLSELQRATWPKLTPFPGPPASSDYVRVRGYKGPAISA